MADTAKSTIYDRLAGLLKTVDTSTEYIHDGLIYCKACGDCKVYINETYGVVMRKPCKCFVDKVKKERAQEQAATRQYQIDRMRVNSLLKGEYLQARFENTGVVGVDDTFVKAMARCRKYCDNADEVKRRGLGIYFYGGNGVGKTRLMACMANSLIDKGYGVLFTNQTWISERLRTRKYTSDTLNTLDKLIDIDFLFIDELTADVRDSTSLYNIINSRVIDKKPTLYSSNYSLGEIGEIKGYEAIVSRILQLDTVFKIQGEDYRVSNRNKGERAF